MDKAQGESQEVYSSFMKCKHSNWSVSFSLVKLQNPNQECVDLLWIQRSHIYKCITLTAGLLEVTSKKHAKNMHIRINQSLAKYNYIHHLWITWVQHEIKNAQLLAVLERLFGQPNGKTIFLKLICLAIKGMVWQAKGFSSTKRTSRTWNLECW